ncbi:MAG: DUF3501 family protein [SAR324 cluster bacterium]|nr:DUF3501 family protein [SAR324 cluster bacterium]
MRPVERHEIVDYVTYEEQRNAIREQVLKTKESRRIHIGDHLTFLFENTETVRYQVQEMMRTEKIVKESDIQHEINTYNELLGAEGELGCVLLIEYASPEERDVQLRKLLGLPQKLYALLEDGRQIPAKFDERQIGDDRLSSVQYLKFDTGGATPVALGSNHPNLTLEEPLSPEQRQALAEDLATPKTNAP